VIVGSCAGLSVACANEENANALMRDFPGLGDRIFTLESLAPEAPLDYGLVLCAWFGRLQMTRLLYPPVASPLHLILYDLEIMWYRGLKRTRHSSSTSRSEHGDRSQLFPTLQGWKPVEPPGAQDTSQEDETQYSDYERIQHSIRESTRRQVLRDCRSDGSEKEVPARLFSFEGGAYAFLTENYRAKAATHLFENAYRDNDEDISLELTPAIRLKIGDALLFHRGSGRDVIRLAADRLLPPGIRELSGLWKQPLIDFFETGNVALTELWIRLRESGCPLELMTIRNWINDEDMIAPQSYQRDLKAIAQVTGHEDLQNQYDECCEAISQVRSAHLRASHILAQQVLRAAVEAIRAGTSTIRQMEIAEDVLLVRITDIDTEMVAVRASLVNRLQEVATWQE
jgi:hypothetical protein